MVKLLLLVAVVVVLAALWFRLKRTSGAGAHTPEGRDARASKLTAEQTTISRQGRQDGAGGMGF